MAQGSLITGSHTLGMSDIPAGRDRRPGQERRARPRAKRPAARRLPAGRLPVHRPGHDRGQRQHRPDLAGGARLAAAFPEVRAVHLDLPGRGRALHEIWSSSDAEVLAYMDVDLSTDLNALLPLVAPLLSGHSDVAIGTRLARGSRVVRGPKREIISRCYNLLLRTTLGAGFSDAQCGFKAIRADQARQLLPLVADTAWFFDTELLVLAERAGLRIHEVPVDWIDDADSRVDIVATALGDLRGMRGSASASPGAIKVPRLRETGLGPPERAGARLAAAPVRRDRRGDHARLRGALPGVPRVHRRAGRQRAACC